jgi:hypothetical protein
MESESMEFQPRPAAHTFAKMTALFVAAAALTLGACGSTPNPFRQTAQVAAPVDTAIGVNAYLWRASLDTLSFMPLASADPYGGIIITDWYTNPEQPAERFKATVYILDTRLRADGLNVAIHRQARGASGDWVDAATAASTEESIENAILVRARQIRISGR